MGRVNERERLLEQRIVHVGAEIDDEMANQVTADLLLLDAEDGDRGITMYINTPGGSVPAGMAIYDTMMMVGCEVATVAMGLAAGMGLVLLASGTTGHRSALAQARMQLMKPRMAAGPSDPVLQAEIFAKWSRELATIVAESTGHTPAEIERDWDPPRWFTADEAVSYRLIDRIADEARPPRSRAAMRRDWDNPL
jgi:ATP-dependent Clp protease, protease subunit